MSRSIHGFPDVVALQAPLAPNFGAAQWIGRPGVGLGSWFSPVLPAPLFRKEFVLRSTSAVTSAVVSICGLGYFELTLNGRRVGDHVLDPIVTQYEKHVG